MVWDTLIALYLFLAGLGAGAFTFGALSRMGKAPAPRTSIVAGVIAPAAVGVGTLLLVFDAHAGLMNPLRFFNLTANLSSVMAWGVIILCAFLLVAFVVLALVATKRRVPRALDIVGMALSLCTAAYTGVLLGDAYVAFPLWNPAVLPVLFVVSAASAGFAAVALATRIVAPLEAKSLSFSGKTALVLPAAEIVLIAALLAVTATAQGPGAPAAVASVLSLVAGRYAPAFWVGLIAVGLAAPIALELAERRASRLPDEGPSQKGSLARPIAAEACVLFGGFMLRYLVVMAALPVTFAG